MPTPRPDADRPGPDQDRDRIRPPRPCRSYAPGHTVHPIQWNKGSNDPDTKVRGRIVEMDDHQLVVDIAGQRFAFRNHELERARDLLAVIGPEVEVQTRWSLLWFDTYLISISPADRGPLAACRTDGPSDGGFLVR